MRLLHGIDHLLQILKTIAAIAHVATATASSTVVMPLATIMASWLLIAEWAGQSTFGRGVKNLSRLSVCSSIRPGSSQPSSHPAPAAAGSGEGEDATVMDFQRTVDHLVVENQFYVIDNHAVIPIECSRSAT